MESGSKAVCPLSPYCFSNASFSNCPRAHSGMRFCLSFSLSSSVPVYDRDAKRQYIDREVSVREGGGGRGVVVCLPHSLRRYLGKTGMTRVNTWIKG